MQKFRIIIWNLKLFIDGKNFYDQSVDDLINQYDKVRKVSTRQGDDYTTGCLLNYAYFKGNKRLIAVNLSKKKFQMLIQEQFNKY